MATAALTITSSWTSAATGPGSVLIPAIDDFHWAITSGGVPALSLSICPYRSVGTQLSMELAEGETLYVAAHQSFDTTVTTDG